MSDDVRAMLQAQVKKAEELASAMTRDRSEQIGAEKAFMLLAKQMPEYVKSLDARIEADKEAGTSAQLIRRYVHNVVANIQGMCESSAQKARNEVLVCEGRAQTAQMMAATMKKELDSLEKVEAANAARLAKRSEVMFEEARKEADTTVAVVEPPKSKGGRRPLHAVPTARPVAVESDEERKAKVEAAKQARKAAHRNNNGVQNT